jgi:uncharacterized membrane protein YraQ (UPF0718 family)
MKFFLVFAFLASVVDSVPQPTVSRSAQVATPVRPSVRNERQIEIDIWLESALLTSLSACTCSACVLPLARSIHVYEMSLPITHWFMFARKRSDVSLCAVRATGPRM